MNLPWGPVSIRDRISPLQPRSHTLPPPHNFPPPFCQAAPGQRRLLPRSSSHLTFPLSPPPSLHPLFSQPPTYHLVTCLALRYAHAMPCYVPALHEATAPIIRLWRWRELQEFKRKSRQISLLTSQRRRRQPTAAQTWGVGVRPEYIAYRKYIKKNRGGLSGQSQYTCCCLLQAVAAAAAAAAVAAAVAAEDCGEIVYRASLGGTAKSDQESNTKDSYIVLYIWTYSTRMRCPPLLPCNRTARAQLYTTPRPRFLYRGPEISHRPRREMKR